MEKMEGKKRGNQRENGKTGKNIGEKTRKKQEINAGKWGQMGKMKK